MSGKNMRKGQQKPRNTGGGQVLADRLGSAVLLLDILAHKHTADMERMLRQAHALKFRIEEISRLLK